MSGYLEYRLRLKNEDRPPKENKVRKIKQYSDKRAKINREYYARSRPVWKDKPCEINAPGCSKSADGIHHLKGKGTTELLMDEKYWMAACNKCNLFVEENHAWAVERGLKLSRLNKRSSNGTEQNI
ncbi:hypothetical protein [Chitinophaga sp. MM2321]|uniref:hypothetical protein n=1 Tax=Chitinophaga sp. MM2321 TaxID=3137178 RepID=UPI0032D58FC6